MCNCKTTTKSGTVISFGNKRLRAILKNIIANDGELVVPEKTDPKWNKS